MSPTQVADPVSSSINHEPATDWRNVPMFEKVAASHIDRNTAYLNGAIASDERSTSGSYPAAPPPSPDGYARAVDWDRFVQAARSIGTVAYLGTADAAGRPHVGVVMPGFREGALWFVTRVGSRKYRNLAENPEAAFHWSVGGTGPGELAAWGTATLHDDDESLLRLWTSGVVDYDVSSFFGPPEGGGVGFVEVAVRRARLLGPEHRREVYPPA